MTHLWKSVLKYVSMKTWYFYYFIKRKRMLCHGNKKWNVRPLVLWSALTFIYDCKLNDCINNLCYIFVWLNSYFRTLWQMLICIYSTDVKALLSLLLYFIYILWIFNDTKQKKWKKGPIRAKLHLNSVGRWNKIILDKS